MERSRPVLFVVPSVQEACDDAISPWFDRVLPGAWKHSLPSLVIVPTRGQATDLKARLIAKGSSHLGLQFVTPRCLRALLARVDPTPAAEPEHLRLLLAIAASEMEDSPNESEALSAKAVARAPALLLRALDRLETAGWKFEELRLPSFAPLVQRFKKLLEECDFVLPGETDRRHLQRAARGKREFSHVLITGFDGAHWAEWFLLRAAIELADEECTRLGVIFPGGGALPRLVATSLERLEIPHHDGLGHIVPGIFESPEWQAWIELQRAPRLNSFLRFLNALPDPAVVSPKISRQGFEKILRESYKEVLLDDLELLREFCATRVDDKSQSVAEALRALPFLPPRAT